MIVEPFGYEVWVGLKQAPVVVAAAPPADSVTLPVEEEPAESVTLPVEEESTKRVDEQHLQQQQQHDTTFSLHQRNRIQQRMEECIFLKSNNSNHESVMVGVLDDSDMENKPEDLDHNHLLLQFLLDQYPVASVGTTNKPVTTAEGETWLHKAARYSTIPVSIVKHL